MNDIFERIGIPTEELYGNITLVDRIGDVNITWKSSNPNVISDKAEGFLKAGVVNRQERDTKVKLTACVTMKNGEKAEKTFEVTVKAAPKKLVEDDYEGYLFGHFIGEGGPNDEQIYFAVSKDKLNFKDCSDKPVLVSDVGEKGVRDPFICRSFEGDRFFLIATDLSIYNRGGWFKNEQGYYDASTTGSPYLVFWETMDLVNWTSPRLINVAPQNAGMAWAPEIVYYEKTGEYVIFFASSIMDPVTKYKAKPNAIYYVTTRDFVHFSDTCLFIDNQTDDGENAREIIDTTVLKINDFYYSVSKDGDNAEENGGIRILRTKDLLDCSSWEKVLDLDELGLDLSAVSIDALDNSMLEGPELFRFNKKDWKDQAVPEYGIITDQYAVGAGYLPLITNDIEDRTNANGSWQLLSDKDYSFDRLKKRHGTICAITKEEIERLLNM